MDTVTFTGPSSLTARPIGPTFGAEVRGMPIHGGIAFWWCRKRM